MLGTYVQINPISVFLDPIPSTLCNNYNMSVNYFTESSSKFNFIAHDHSTRDAEDGAARQEETGKAQTKVYGCGDRGHDSG